MQEYSVGGCAGMGELLAEANGVGREYAALIMQLSICSNAIIAALDGSGYFDGRTGAYRQFNIKIGQKEAAQIYDARLGFVLPYAVHSWLSGDALRLHFDCLYPFGRGSHYDLQTDINLLAARRFGLATKVKKFIKECFEQRKSEWIISIEIDYDWGKVVIPKSE
jgi:hypothetical protein